MNDPKERTVLAAHFAALGVRPYLAAKCAETIADAAECLSLIAVRECNQELTRNDHQTRQRWQSKASAALAEVKAGADIDVNGGTADALQITFGGDPRGCVVHIIGLPGNTMGGDESGFGL